MELPAGCVDEQAAAAVLGYTQVTWDNESGNENPPASSNKYWAELNDQEKQAVMDMGYTAKSWDNDSGSEPQPASADKYWNQLRVCGEDAWSLSFFVSGHDR